MRRILRLMADKTPEQKAADEALDSAIQLAVKAYSTLPEHAFMIEWLLVVEGADMNEPGIEYTGSHMRGGTMRTSVALGLIKISEGYLLASTLGMISEGDGND
jgi:hypothetical protein